MEYKTDLDKLRHSCSHIMAQAVKEIWPEVKVAIVIGGTASTRQAKQRLGRILRRRGNAKAKLYEIVTAETNETLRSRKRRRSDAYTKTRRFKKT